MCVRVKKEIWRTLVTTLSFLPWLKSDLETAFSMRWIVLVSSSYNQIHSQPKISIVDFHHNERIKEITWALVMFNSISPLCALIKVWNFSITPSNRPNRLFSARAPKKFLRMSPLSPPATCCNSWMIFCLSLTVRVGAFRTVVSLGSCLKTSPSCARDLATWSREEVLAEAVY